MNSNTNNQPITQFGLILNMIFNVIVNSSFFYKRMNKSKIQFQFRFD